MKPRRQNYTTTHDGFKHSSFVRKKRQRVWFDIPYRDIRLMTIQLADHELLDTIQKNVDFMKENVLENDL